MMDLDIFMINKLLLYNDFIFFKIFDEYKHFYLYKFLIYNEKCYFYMIFEIMIIT